MINKLRNKKIMVATITNIFAVIMILLLNFKLIDMDMSDNINKIFTTVLTLIVTTLVQWGIFTDSNDV